MAPVSLRLAVGAAASTDPDFEATHAALCRVFAPLRPDLRLEPVPAPEGDGYSVALHAPAPATRVGVPVSLHRVRSYYPAIKAQQRRLDVLFISPPDGGTEIDAALVETACRLAQLQGRRHVTVLGADAAAAGGDALLLRRGVDVTRLDVGAAARALVTGPDVLDVVVASHDTVGILAEVAGALTGSAVLSTRVDCAAGGLRATTAFAGDDALPSLPGLVLAASEAMVLGGRLQAARQLTDAFCRALEDGIRSAEFDVTHPYARLVDDAQFADELVERLGTTPRCVAPCFAAADGGARRRPRMRVIDGGR